LIYEVQQSSDLTYRVYDWGRPQTGGRGLHIEKSLATIDPAAVAPFYPAPALGDDGRAILVRCPYFTLELLAAQARPVELETAGQTFHALTVIDGRAEVATAREGIVLGRFDSAIIPAVCGRYHLRPLGAVRVLKAASEEIGA
jgi:mannose-6-phosphate isomerase